MTKERPDFGVGYVSMLPIVGVLNFLALGSACKISQFVGEMQAASASGNPHAVTLAAVKAIGLGLFDAAVFAVDAGFAVRLLKNDLH